MKRILLALVSLLAGQASAQVIALTRATVIDGTGAAPRRDVTVVMENGRIRGLGPNLRAPDGATVVDLNGKYVVPGIINAHGHVGENRARNCASTRSTASPPPPAWRSIPTTSLDSRPNRSAATCAAPVFSR